MLKIKKESPFFTVITCTKDSEKFVLKNIISVSAQTFKDYEHVFVDGYSNDNTGEIIKRYLRKDTKRNKLFMFPSHGIGNAFNQGIRKSSGKYLIFLNSDDYFYDKDVLRDVAAYLGKSSSLEWVYGIINVIEKNGKSLGVFPKYWVFKHKFPYLLKFINYIPHQGVFIKREVFNKFGLFNENLSSKMDYDFWLRIARNTNWAFIERIISNFTVRKDAETSSKKNITKNLQNLHEVQKKHLNIFELSITNLINLYLSRRRKILR